MLGGEGVEGEVGGRGGGGSGRGGGVTSEPPLIIVSIIDCDVMSECAHIYIVCTLSTGTPFGCVASVTTRCR